MRVPTDKRSGGYAPFRELAKQVPFHWAERC